MYRLRRRKESGIARKVALLKDGILPGVVAEQGERHRLVGLERVKQREHIAICQRIYPSRASIHNSGHNAKWLKDS